MVFPRVELGNWGTFPTASHSQECVGLEKVLYTAVSSPNKSAPSILALEMQFLNPLLLLFLRDLVGFLPQSYQIQPWSSVRGVPVQGMALFVHIGQF